jgi:hypothetical protein
MNGALPRIHCWSEKDKTFIYSRSKATVSLKVGRQPQYWLKFTVIFGHPSFKKEK